MMEAKQLQRQREDNTGKCRATGAAARVIGYMGSAVSGRRKLILRGAGRPHFAARSIGLAGETLSRILARLSSEVPRRRSRSWTCRDLN